MKKKAVVATILDLGRQPASHQEMGHAFAPTNIALCKYWGKRDTELNLPATPSLSLSLGQKGASCTLRRIDQAYDTYFLNGQPLELLTPFSQRLKNYLDLFRPADSFSFQVTIQTNIPVAAGLASSACGFASLALALNDFFAWELDQRHLSILARLGSGSACRSITPGFVEWHEGVLADGMDSYGESLKEAWPELCIGLVILTEKEKPLSSRAAMERTVATSHLYSSWPLKVKTDLALLKQAIKEQDFKLLGETAESNALTMHALMLSAWPPISYALPETVLAMQRVWELRQDGLAIYFTQDAGPNLKLLFLAKDAEQVRAYFPGVEVLQPQAT
jgi:diphosphomevalonate decarboxylase